MMSREWDKRAERQGGMVVGMRRRTLLIVFVASAALGAMIASLAKSTFGL